MNETQLMFSRIVIQINIIQEVIAIKEVNENTIGVQKKKGLNMMDQSKLADFHFR